MSNLNSLYDSILQESDPSKRLQLIEKCQKWTLTLDLFSDNESLKEISTMDLKFLEIPALKGLALSELNFENSRERLEILKKSRENLLEFLESVERLGLATLNKSKPSRQELIMAFKKEKEIQSNIKILKTRNDEESQRELFLENIQLQILKSKQLLSSNTMEIDLLEKHEESLTNEKVKDNSQHSDSRLEIKNGPLLSKEGKILRPFIIRSNRQDLKDKVFKPGHNLPSMTVDEYLTREFERGNFLKGGTQGKTEKIIHDMNEEELEKKLMKERAWDEFKDDNPKGWGNRANKS